MATNFSIRAARVAGRSASSIRCRIAYRLRLSRAAKKSPAPGAALDAAPEAADFFGTLDSRNRYAILHRIQEAKRPGTRAARIEKFVAMLAEGEKIHP